MSTLRGELRGGRRGARGQNGEGSSEKEWKRRRVERVQCDSAQHLSLAQKKISYPKKNLGFKIGFEEVWLYNKIINVSVNPTSLSPPTRLPPSFHLPFPSPCSPLLPTLNRLPPRRRRRRRARKEVTFGGLPRVASTRRRRRRRLSLFLRNGGSLSFPSLLVPLFILCSVRPCVIPPHPTPPAAGRKVGKSAPLTRYFFSRVKGERLVRLSDSPPPFALPPFVLSLIESPFQSPYSFPP